MYSSEGQFLALVQQALGRDIRSVHQRLRVEHAPTQAGRGAARGAAAGLGAPAAVGPANGSGVGASGDRTPRVGIADPPELYEGRPSCSDQAIGGEGPGTGDPWGASTEQSTGEGRRAGEEREGEDSEEGVAKEGASQVQGFYHIVLEGIDISYDVLSDGMVHVRSAAHWQPRHL